MPSTPKTARTPRQEASEEEEAGSRRGTARHRCGPEAARGRQVGSGRAGPDHRAQRRQPAAGDHGQGAALSRHRLSAAEEAGAGHRRSDERAVAEGWTGRGRSQRRAEAAVIRLSGSGTGRQQRADRAGRADAARATRTASASEAVTSPAGVRLPQSIERRMANPFAGWFGGSSSAPPARRHLRQRHRRPHRSRLLRPRRLPLRPGQSPADGRSNTEVRGGPEPAAPSVAAAKPEGRFRIQVGMVRTQAEAQSLAVRVKREHGAVLASARARDRRDGGGQHGLVLPGAHRPVCERAGGPGRLRQAERSPASTAWWSPSSRRPARKTQLVHSCMGRMCAARSQSVAGGLSAALRRHHLS